MSLPDDSFLDDQIRASTCDAVPPAVEARLRTQLADFRALQGARGAADATRDRGGARAPWWRLGVACAAVALLMAVAVVLLRPRTSLAEVAKAVFDRPWVHMRVTGDGQGEGKGEDEFWFSPARNVSASKGPDAIKYDDYRLQVSESYDPGEGVVTRIPIVWDPPGRGFESMAVALAALLQEGRPPEKPLERLDFLGPGREAMSVLGQRVERVTEAGRAWLDYHLTVAEPTSKQHLQLLFRVDVATKLPILCRIRGQADGKPATRETRFDYPETGPADLYALGVPRTAKRVDRVPAGDVKRILETIKAGRERMDNYRAVFVMQPDLPDTHWWTYSPVVFSRKGTKYRADYPFGEAANFAPARRPGQGEDLGTWWRERTKSFRYYTQYVVRDTTTFTSDVKWSTDPDGTPHAEIVSVLRMESANNPGEIYPPEWSMRPEFACRPPMGVGHPDLEPVLDMHPADGPAGCVLLKLRHTSTKNRVNEKGIGIPDRYRYWLDPGRDYIVMRWDMLMHDADGRERIIESDTTEETARSPQGVWYATRIRRSSPGRDAKDRSSDQVYHLYVDFGAELPDALFEPPSPGKLR